jgi:hypothetical protein
VVFLQGISIKGSLKIVQRDIAMSVPFCRHVAVMSACREMHLER